MIALCRALNIPARFVTAYTRYETPPPDFHAVVEAYLGDRWHLFDPTQLAPISDLVRLGTGRDALDVRGHREQVVGLELVEDIARR